MLNMKATYIDSLLKHLIIFVFVDNKSSESESTNARGGRRRAAAQAVGSLKELPSNKKLRQGDQQFNKSFQYSKSIHSEEETKPKKGSRRK